MLHQTEPVMQTPTHWGGARKRRHAYLGDGLELCELNSAAHSSYFAPPLGVT